MVVVHVLEPRFGLVAAGPDVVVGDTLHRDGLRVTAGAGDHLLDLVAMIFVVPPGRHLVAVTRRLDP